MRQRSIQSLFGWFVVLSLSGCRSTPPPPMAIGMWYWHTPFEVKDDEIGWLKKIGVSTLYVRTATFTTDGIHVKTSVPQTWKSRAGGLSIVLTFNFDGGLRSHFRSFPVSTMAADIVHGISQFRMRAESKGVRVSGIQMDVDCPTRLLPKYAELLQRIRSRLVHVGSLKPTDTFSATALQTWLTSTHYQDLADACDYVVPQFYEGQIGRSVDQIHPIADTGNIENGMHRADSASKPFFVGLATYGHSLLFDDRGRLISMYHGMQPEEAMRHPSLQVERSDPLNPLGSKGDKGNYIGENLLMMKAVHPDMNGRGRGYHIAYVLPTSQMLARELDVLRKGRPSNCQGIILYRFPEPKDEFCLPLSTMEQCIHQRTASLGITPSIHRTAVPWSLIGTENHAKTPAYEYSVDVKLSGNIPTIAGPGAFSVLVRLDRMGVEHVERGDFDDATTGIIGDDRSFQPCSPAHANAVLLRRYYVPPSARLRSGPILIGADGPQPTRLNWSTRTGGGFAPVEGELDLSDHMALEGKAKNTQNR